MKIIWMKRQQMVKTGPSCPGLDGRLINGHGEGWATDMAACQLYFGHGGPGSRSCRCLRFFVGR